MTENMKPRKTFSKVLEELLKDRDMSLAELAKISNATVDSCENWIHGRSLPSIRQISVLSDFFGVTPEHLLGVSKKEAAARLSSRMQGLSEKNQRIVQSLIDELLAGA